jgi:predicted RNA-binding Zn-ribbon protein involved in translation (DUF1610 family)
MIPTYPTGATLASIVLASIRAGRVPSATVANQDMVRPPWKVDGRLGHAAAKICKDVLDGTIAPDELIERHSLFPLYAAYSSPDPAITRRKMLREGQYAQTLQRYARIGCSTSHPLRLRQCNTCLSEDLEHHGTGHWRVIHQALGIRFCHLHDELLQDECGSCAQPFGKRGTTTLPGDPCPNCGSRATRSSLSRDRSAGYDAYANMILRALDGTAPELAPNARKGLVYQLIQSVQGNHEQLITEFSGWWKASVHSLRRLLESISGIDDLTPLLIHGDANLSEQWWIALTAFAKAHLSEQACAEAMTLAGPVTHDLVAEANGLACGKEFRSELKEVIRTMGLPHHLELHISGGRLSRAERLVGEANVSYVLSALSLRSIQQLAEYMDTHAGANPIMMFGSVASRLEQQVNC